MYNADVDLFAALSFKFEFWPSGGVTPSASIAVIKFPLEMERLLMQIGTVILMIILAYRAFDEITEISLNQLLSILRIVAKTDISVDQERYETMFVGIAHAKLYNCRKRRKSFNTLAKRIEYHDRVLLDKKMMLECWPAPSH